MPARNYKQWNRVPGKINSGEYVDSRIYSDKKIFEEEIEKIFSKVWIPVCHESELPKTNSFRTMTVAMQSIIVVRISDKDIKAYHNQSINKPVGTLSALTFPDEHEIRTEVKYGGFIWVTLNEEMDKTVEEWASGSFDCMQKSLDAEPLEVFHYHKAIIPCNYKLWHDTNSEFYHDYLHYHNRVTGFNDSYFARKNIGFDNGHINVGSFEVQYDQYEGSESRDELSFPHLPANHWEMIDFFPGVNFNLRGSALRCDIMTPIAPDKVMIEFRGLGLKSDTPEERLIRQRHHNSIWGPFGRNLHEDLLAVSTQQATMNEYADARRILHGRHEVDADGDPTIHDEEGMRHFYDEWGRWMNRWAGNPDLDYHTGFAASALAA
jgi:methanesulfonate monooxygenase large subunit